MRGCIEVIFKFQQQIHRKPGRAGFERVVEDEVCDIEPGIKVRLTGNIQIRGIRHSIGSKSAWREFREGTDGGASWTFSADRIRSGARPGGRCLDRECARCQQRVWAVPVLIQERCGGGPWPRVKRALRLHTKNV